MSLLGSSTAPRPRVPSPGELFRLAGDALGHRAGLAGLELAEARDHALFSALLAAGLVFLILFSGCAFTLLVAALVWESPNRAWWIGGLCGVYVTGAAIALLVLRHRLQTWRPLAETRTQLREDQQCLSQLIKSALP